jgi:hypothetical protein
MCGIAIFVRCIPDCGNIRSVSNTVSMLLFRRWTVLLPVVTPLRLRRLYFFYGRSGTLTNSDVIIGDESSATIHLYVKGPLQVNTNASTGSWCYQFAGTGEIHYPLGPDLSSAKYHIFDSSDFDGYHECSSTFANDSSSPNTSNVIQYMYSRFEGDESLPCTFLGENEGNGTLKGQDGMNTIRQWSKEGVNSMILPFLIQRASSFISPFVCQIAVDMTSSTSADDVTVFVARADKTRVDLSKTDRWRLVLNWAELNGIALHILLEDSSGDNFFDDGVALGPQPKLYYREIVSRFGNYLGLTWDLGNSNPSSMAQRAWSQKKYIYFTTFPSWLG